MNPLQVLLRAPAIGARAISVAFAFVVLAVLVAAGAAVQTLADSQQITADRAAKNSVDLVRISRITPQNDRTAADGLAVRLAGSGLDVQVRPRPVRGSDVPARIGAPPGRAPGFGGPINGGGARPELGMLLVLTMTGVHADRVPVGRFEVSIGPDLRGLATMAKRIFAGALMLITVIGLVLFAVLRVLNREAIRPLQQTTEALRRLAARDFTPRAVDGRQRGQIGELARAYTQAAETVATALDERRLAEAEMQRFIADAGHELKTPLTVIMGFVDVLERGGLSAATSARLYASMRAETGRMRGMIENLIVLARLGSPDAPKLDLIDAASVADSVAEHLADAAAPRAVTVDRDGSPAIVVATEDDLYDAIFNCAENALKYGDGSDVRITVGNRAGRVAIEIADGGRGMTPDDQRRAFERFYRGDHTRGIAGSGLGLSIVKRVVEKFHGTVAIASGASGTTVRLELPAVPDHGREERDGSPLRGVTPRTY